MGYDRGDSFPSNFEPNVISFGSKLVGKLSQFSQCTGVLFRWDKTSFMRVSNRVPFVILRIEFSKGLAA